MKSERWFWKNRLRPILNSASLLYDRIESSTSVSVPDVAVCGNYHGWIEMKVAKIKQGVFSLPTLTAGQKVWIKGRGNKAGKVYILAWDWVSDYMWIFDHTICEKTKIPVDDANKISLYHDKSTNVAKWVPVIKQCLNHK